MKKLFIKIIPLVLIATVLGVFAIGCGQVPEDSGTPAEAQTYVSIAINPEVEFTVDENGVVLSVNCLNSDAEILLADVDLSGMPIEAATERFVELATEAGYIDVTSETNNVTITVIDENSDTENSIENKLEQRIYGFFDNNGIFGMVSKETLEAYAEQAAALDVSVGKMKMILRAIDLNPELTLEELAAMEMKDLVKLIKKRHSEDKIDHTAREQFKTELEALKTEFAAMFTLGEEIEALQESLETFEGTEEERAAIEQTIDEKQTQHDELKVQFEIRKEAIMDEAKSVQNQIKEQRKTEKRQRVEQNKDANNAHKAQFQNNREAKTNQVREWRASRQANGN